MKFIDKLSNKKLIIVALAGVPVIIVLLALSNHFMNQDSPSEKVITGPISQQRALQLAKQRVGEPFYLHRPRDIVRFDDGGKKDQAGIVYIRREDAAQLKTDKSAFTYLLLEEKSTPQKSSQISREAAKVAGWKKEGPGWIAYAMPGPVDTFPALFVVSEDGSVYMRLIANNSVRTDRKSQERLLDSLRWSGYSGN